MLSFIGSCTNSRISDLRQAAEVFKGRTVKDDVRVMVVPGSQGVKRQAEAEGLDAIFKEAGAEWREAGCSMCIAMNGDQLEPGQYAVSTSNRNFEGRQGKGGRTFLSQPADCCGNGRYGRCHRCEEFELRNLIQRNKGTKKQRFFLFLPLSSLYLCPFVIIF